MRVKDQKTIVKKYVERSLMGFIDGDKYGRKPQSINWIIGIIRKSGIQRKDLREIFSHLRTYPQTQEEQSCFHLALGECKNLGFLD